MGCSQSKISSSGRVHSLKKKWNDMKKELSDFTASLEYRIYLIGITCEKTVLWKNKEMGYVQRKGKRDIQGKFKHWKKH